MRVKIKSGNLAGTIQDLPDAAAQSLLDTGFAERPSPSPDPVPPPATAPDAAPDAAAVEPPERAVEPPARRRRW
jgi:hypothetical protein